MNFAQLNALVAVAEHRSFTAAAAALHTVQSNVSTHVARLERELGAPLVDRDSHHLTAEGQSPNDAWAWPSSRPTTLGPPPPP